MSHWKKPLIRLYAMAGQRGSPTRPHEASRMAGKTNLKCFLIIVTVSEVSLAPALSIGSISKRPLWVAWGFRDRHRENLDARWSQDRELACRAPHARPIPFANRFLVVQLCIPASSTMYIPPTGPQPGYGVTTYRAAPAGPSHGAFQADDRHAGKSKDPLLVITRFGWAAAGWLGPDAPLSRR